MNRVMNRRAAIPAFSDALRAAGLERCVLVTSKRGAGERDGSVQSGQTGEDAGGVALSDVHLLSHADVLICAFGSTFATLIYQLMAVAYVHPGALRHQVVSAARRTEATPRVVLCDEPGKSDVCGPELPLLATQRASWWHLSLSEWPRGALITGSTDQLRGGAC